MKLYGNWELPKEDLPAQFFSYSDAYLDSARRLCVVLKKSTRKASYSRGCVTLFLTFHATELFLKGAILYKNPKEKLNHDLEGYYKWFKKLYPKKKFMFELPFHTDYSGLQPELIEFVKKQQPPPDQLNKYPTDKNGKEWEGASVFEPIDFLSIIDQLRSDFKRIKKEIVG